MPSRKAYSARLSKMYNVTLFIAFTSQLMWHACVKTAGTHPYKYKFLEKKDKYLVNGRASRFPHHHPH